MLEPTLNPMVYAYSLPLFCGLAMATPLSTRRRLIEMVVAIAVIWIAQAFGIVGESLKFVAFDAGAPGAAAIAQGGPRAERDCAGLPVRLSDPAGGRAGGACGSG